MVEKIRWCVIENPPGRDIPEWQRTAAIDSKGVVFAPAAFSDRPESHVMMCVMFDGVDAIQDNGHLYVPAEWIKNEFPEMTELCDKVIKKVTDHFRLDLSRN
jgi:hypothetical protein